MRNTKKLVKHKKKNNNNQPIIAPILVGIALMGNRGWVILIAGRLNCGRSILNLFDYTKAIESPGDGHRSAISRSATEIPSGYGP